MFKQRPVFYSKRGTSLLEVVIASAILLISVLAFTQVSRNADQLTRSRLVKQRALQTFSTIREQIQFSNFCTAAFTGTTVAFNPLFAVPATFTQDLSLNIPGIRSGSASGDPNIISATAPNNVDELKGFEVLSLRLTDVFEIPGTSINGHRDYYGIVYLQLGGMDRVGGGLMRERPVGALILRVQDATSDVLSCEGSTNSSIAEVCTEFGCSYDASQNPPCDCPRPPIGCAAGSLPVAVKDNVFECLAWGGQCDPGEYVVAAGIESVDCAPGPASGGPVPPPTPTPAASFACSWDTVGKGDTVGCPDAIDGCASYCQSEATSACGGTYNGDCSLNYCSPVVIGPPGNYEGLADGTYSCP